MTRVVAGALVAALLAATSAAQEFGFSGFGFRGRFQLYPNTPYDGRFTFVRVRYNHLPGGTRERRGAIGLSLCLPSAREPRDRFDHTK